MAKFASIYVAPNLSSQQFLETSIFHIDYTYTTTFFPPLQVVTSVIDKGGESYIHARQRRQAWDFLNQSVQARQKAEEQKKSFALKRLRYLSLRKKVKKNLEKVRGSFGPRY